MEIPKIYESNKTEAKWYKYWMENDYFKSTPDDRESYTVVIPPLFNLATTFASVAIEAWSVPGTQQAFLPNIRALLTNTS